MIKRSRMLKKSLAVLTALTLGLTLTDFNPLVQETKRILAAETLVASGDCSATISDSVTWSVYDTDGDSQGDKLVISGTGKTHNYTQYNASPLTSYSNTIKNIIVEEGITHLGNELFGGEYRDNYTAIESVTLPNSLTVIGDKTFIRFTTLPFIDIPDNVESIGEKAFWGCTALTINSLPSNLTLLGAGAFALCESIDSITIPDGVTSLSNDVFSCCYNLQSCNLHSAMTSLGQRSFSDCKKLTSIDIPESINFIGSGCFSRCKELESITIPNNVTTIEDETFCECDKLSNVNLPVNITSIGKSAFSECIKLQSITIPSNTTVIGERAFESCELLESVSLPESLLKIDEWAFSFCKNLQNVSLPSGLTTIGNYAFDFCEKLVLPDLPASLQSVGDSAFYECIGREELIIPTGVTSIGSDAFDMKCPEGNPYGTHSIKSLYIPNTVTFIGEDAFKYIVGVKLDYNPLADYQQDCFSYVRTLFVKGDVSDISFVEFDDHVDSAIVENTVDTETLIKPSNIDSIYKLNSAGDTIESVYGDLILLNDWNLKIDTFKPAGDRGYYGNYYINKMIIEEGAMPIINANIFFQEPIDFNPQYTRFLGDLHIPADTDVFITGFLDVDGTVYNDGTLVLKNQSRSSGTDVSIHKLENHATGRTLMRERFNGSIDTIENAGKLYALPTTVDRDARTTRGVPVTYENNNLKHSPKWKDFEVSNNTFKYDLSIWDITYKNNTEPYSGSLDVPEAPRVDYKLKDSIYKEYDNFNIRIDSTSGSSGGSTGGGSGSSSGGGTGGGSGSSSGGSTGGGGSSSNGGSSVTTTKTEPYFYVDDVKTPIGNYKVIKDVPVPSKAEKIFVEWRSKDNKPFNITDPIKENMRIYSNWKDAPSSGSNDNTEEQPMISTVYKSVTVMRGGSVNPEAYVNLIHTTMSDVNVDVEDSKFATFNTKTNMIDGLEVGTTIVTLTASDGSKVLLNLEVVDEEHPEKDIKNSPYVLIEKNIIKGSKFNIELENKSKIKSMKWTSEDKSVATVSQKGLIKGIDYGKSTVTCTITNKKDNKYKVYIKIKVVDEPGQNIQTKRTDAETIKTQFPVLVMDKKVYLGKATQIEVKNADDAEIVYSVKDTSICKVSKTGKLTGKKLGRTNVVVCISKNGQKYYYRLEVRVLEQPEI